MANDRKRDQPRLDETMGQGVGSEPQPSNTLPEAVVGQAENPQQGPGQADESDMSSGIGKVRDGEPQGGTIPEHSGQQSGGLRNGRGTGRHSREEIVDRDLESPEDTDRGAEREK
jgi:hypothetical protein